MSNLNNKYGTSNLCPAIMSDGRGVKTNFQNSHNNTADLRKTLNATGSYDFRSKLQQEGSGLVDVTLFQNISEFSCKEVPHGNVKLSPKINLDNGPKASFLDAFKPITE